jgi:hypothetical protein
VLWKQLNPAYRRLLRTGAQGEAVVVGVRAERQKNELAPNVYGWYVTLRVKFADGGTADFERYLEATVLSEGISVSEDPEAGMVIPIRFDPKKRSRVEIDTAALRAQHERRRADLAAQTEATEDAAVQRAERDLKPLGPEAP